MATTLWAHQDPNRKTTRREQIQRHNHLPLDIVLILCMTAADVEAIEWICQLSWNLQDSPGIADLVTILEGLATVFFPCLGSRPDSCKMWLLFYYSWLSIVVRLLSSALVCVEPIVIRVCMYANFKIIIPYERRPFLEKSLWLEHEHYNYASSAAMHMQQSTTHVVIINPLVQWWSSMNILLTQVKKEGLD